MTTKEQLKAMLKDMAKLDSRALPGDVWVGLPVQMADGRTEVLMEKVKQWREWARDGIVVREAAPGR